VDGINPTARVLVVANPGEAPELVSALASPWPAGPVEVVTGDGGDDTLQAFAQRRPDVVVVAASLDAGDARALIAAMREGGEPVHVVLVGDARGPIRNALDASDFGVDRFVARPLSAKALRFAVGRAVGATVRAPTGGEGSAPRRSAMIAAAGAGSGPANGAAVAAAAAAGQGADVPEPATEGPTTPMSVHDVPTRPISSLRARWEALADALELEDEPDATLTPAPVTIHPRRGAGEAASEPAAPAAADPDAAAAADEPSWDALPVREPTLILTEPEMATPLPSGPNLEAATPAAEPADDAAADDLDDDAVPASAALDLTERQDGGHWTTAPSVRAVEVDEPDHHEDLGDDLDEDLAADAPDIGEVSASRALPASLLYAASPGPAPDAAAGDVAAADAPAPADPAAAAPDAPPSGGGFARELRQKMSLMAERLFRSGAAAPPTVALGPSHDHHTEIDLASIAEPPDLPSPTLVYDTDDDTFGGADAAEPTQTGVLHGRTGETGETGETGAIVRGQTDAPALIARLAAQQLTGRLVLRRGSVEKVVYVDAGRPVFASSSEDADRMGQLLVREGKITDEQFARCDELVRDTGRRMGKILVEQGYLKRRELLPAVRRHVEDILYSTFAWDEGDYRIVAGDGAAAERIRLSRDPAAMVLEGVRRKLDLATLERLVGAPSTVVEITDRERLAAAAAAADLAVDERAALAGLDGKVDLAHVARASGASLAVVYALAWALVLLGVAQARRRAGEAADDDAPGIVGETDLAIDRERVHARHRLVADADYFALLGVRRDATSFEIRRAYEAARKDFAADAFPSELRRELRLELAEIAQVLDEAHRVLRDDRLRSDYLTHLID
jgi:Domain of unknown function (DUF4388)